MVLPVSNKTLTRSFTFQVIGPDGKTVKAGTPVTLPAAKIRGLEARFNLEPCEDPEEAKSTKENK